jgi:hypothetical protein
MNPMKSWFHSSGIQQGGITGNQIKTGASAPVVVCISFNFNR